MTVQSYIESYVPLWMVQQSVYSTKVKLMQLKDFQHIYVLTVIFNCDVNERYIYNWCMSFVNYHKFHINVMQSFIIVLRALICNSKNTLIQIPLLYNFLLCWLLNYNVNFFKKWIRKQLYWCKWLFSQEFFCVHCIYIMSYTFNIMICDKKKYKVRCLINID